MVAPAEPCLSPTKGELVYSKTAKQCLEEISGSTLLPLWSSFCVCVGVWKEDAATQHVIMYHLRHLSRDRGPLLVSMRMHTVACTHFFF